jgi:hypothetical protein
MFGKTEGSMPDEGKLFDMDDMDLDPLSQAFMREVAHKIGLQHMTHIDQLAAAFIARYHCDPVDCEVVTACEQGEAGWVWRTYIQRRRHDGSRNTGQA